jgi:hypothetical protein
MPSDDENSLSALSSTPFLRATLPSLAGADAVCSPAGSVPIDLSNYLLMDSGVGASVPLKPVSRGGLSMGGFRDDGKLGSGLDLDMGSYEHYVSFVAEKWPVYTQPNF